MVAYWSSDVEHSAAKEKRKLLLKNRIPPFTLRVGRVIISDWLKSVKAITALN